MSRGLAVAAELAEWAAVVVVVVHFAGFGFQRRGRLFLGALTLLQLDDEKVVGV